MGFQALFLPSTENLFLIWHCSPVNLAFNWEWLQITPMEMGPHVSYHTAQIQWEKSKNHCKRKEIFSFQAASPAPGAEVNSTVSSQIFSGELLHLGWFCLVTPSRASTLCQCVWPWLRSDVGLQELPALSMCFYEMHSFLDVKMST